MERFGFIQRKTGEWVCVKTSNGPWCQYEQVEYVLAEKDKEISKWQLAHDDMVRRNRLLRDLPNMPIERPRSYDELMQACHALMRQAVEFAENTIYIMGALCSNRHELESNGHVLKARAFLSCPEVQAWRKQDGEK